MQAALKKINKNGKKTVLLEILAQLPHKEQMEIHQHLSRRLHKKAAKVSANGAAAERNNEFFQTEFGQYILAEADERISIERVRKALAKSKSSFAAEIIAEREER
jgi:hypothetical protein